MDPKNFYSDIVKSVVFTTLGKNLSLEQVGLDPKILLTGFRKEAVVETMTKKTGKSLVLSRNVVKRMAKENDGWAMMELELDRINGRRSSFVLEDPSNQTLVRIVKQEKQNKSFYGLDESLDVAFMGEFAKFEIVSVPMEQWAWSVIDGVVFSL